MLSSRSHADYLKIDTPFYARRASLEQALRLPLGCFTSMCGSTTGVVDSIVSDRGLHFVSSMWDRFCQILGVKQKLSTAYHPETDGRSENTNQWVEQFLRMFVNYDQKNWEELLPAAE